jgi:RNA polymerase primary sigma factor
VGRTFNVTRERIRQIENQSLKKLRALAEAVKLRDVA